MASLGTLFEPEQAIDRWEKQKAEEARKEAREAEERRMEEIAGRKDALQYSEKAALEICERISAGELLTVICLDEHMPTVRRFNQWLKAEIDLSALYNEALHDRLNIFEEQLIQIPDEASRDLDIVTLRGNTKRTLDPAKVTMAKLRVEVRRMHLKAMRPQKWGDVSTLVTKSADDEDFANMSSEELESRIAEMEVKDRSFRGAKVA